MQDNVEPTSPSKTIEITVVSGSDIGADMIQAYLEGPASGGGDKEVEVMTCVSNGVYRAKLSSIEGMYLYHQPLITVKHSIMHFISFGLKKHR